MRKLISKWRDLVAWWESKPKQEQKRLKSFIPWFLYGVVVLYGVIYLSVLSSVNRYKTGTTVKSWWGGDAPAVTRMKEEQAREIEASFKELRKKVSGNR
jgi:hypothetical protein